MHIPSNPGFSPPAWTRNVVPEGGETLNAFYRGSSDAVIFHETGHGLPESDVARWGTVHGILDREPETAQAVARQERMGDLLVEAVKGIRKPRRSSRR